jgi:hypothetical protein
MRQQLDVAMGNEAAGDGGAETMCCRRCGGGAIQIEFEGMNVRKAEDRGDARKQGEGRCGGEEEVLVIAAMEGGGFCSSAWMQQRRAR